LTCIIKCLESFKIVYIKAYDVAPISQFHAILVRSYHNFACFLMCLSIWI